MYLGKCSVLKAATRAEVEVEDGDAPTAGAAAPHSKPAPEHWFAVKVVDHRTEEEARLPASKELGRARCDADRHARCILRNYIRPCLVLHSAAFTECISCFYQRMQVLSAFG